MHSALHTRRAFGKKLIHAFNSIYVKSSRTGGQGTIFFSSVLLYFAGLFHCIQFFEHSEDLLPYRQSKNIILSEVRVVQSAQHNCLNHHPDHIFTLKNKTMHLPWFKRLGIFFIPKAFFGWIILLAGLVYAVYTFMDIDSRSHSASDTLINFVYHLLIIAAVYTLIAFLTSRKE